MTDDPIKIMEELKNSIEAAMLRREELAEKNADIAEKAGFNSDFHREAKELQELYPRQYSAAIILVNNCLSKNGREMEKLLNIIIMAPESIQQHICQILKNGANAVPAMIDSFYESANEVHGVKK